MKPLLVRECGLKPLLSLGLQKSVDNGLSDLAIGPERLSQLPVLVCLPLVRGGHPVAQFIHHRTGKKKMRLDDNEGNPSSPHVRDNFVE